MRSGGTENPFFQSGCCLLHDDLQSRKLGARFSLDNGEVGLQVICLGTNLHLCSLQSLLQRKRALSSPRITINDEKSVQSCCSGTGGAASAGTGACSPAPIHCLMSLKMMRRFSRIVFTQAKRPICGK